MKFWNDVQVLFVYDTKHCNTEEDDPKDAIIYFFPLEIPESTRCALCGQLMGMVQFFTSTFAEPKLIHLRKSKFALKNIGRYTIFLGGNVEMPDSVLTRQLASLYGLFQFYHRTIDAVRKGCRNDKLEFTKKMAEIWQCYLPVSQHQGNTLSLTFEVLPSLELPKSGGIIFLRALQILQSCQAQFGVLGGCILSSGGLLCSQIPPNIVSNFSFISTDNPQLPAEHASSASLPYGVTIVYIYLTQEMCRDILNYNKNKGELIDGCKSSCSGINSRNNGSQSCSRDQQNLEFNEIDTLSEITESCDLKDHNVIRNRTQGLEADSDKECQKMCLYIQSHSKTQLFLIMEENTCLDLNRLNQLWKTGLSSLVDLEMDITHLTECLPKQMSSNEYCYLQHDEIWKSVKTSKPIVAFPTQLEDQLFNRTTQVLHELLQGDSSLQDHSVIFGDSVMYGHKMGSLETFYQEMRPQAPTRESLSVATNLLSSVSVSAREKLEKDHSIILL